MASPFRYRRAIGQRDYPLVQGIVVVVRAGCARVDVHVDLLVACSIPAFSF